MCTVSWLSEPAGYQVFFNRDERRTRAAGLPPELSGTEEVTWLAPRDGEQLGTWIGANRLGITIGLANRYEESPLPTAGGRFVSRGHLVGSLLDVGDLDGLERRLRTADLTVFQPFTIVAFAAGEPALCLGWDSTVLLREDVPSSGLVLTSSGYDQAEAARVRGVLFAEAHAAGRWTGDDLEALHRSHLPERGPFSICMHRADALTVSFTRVAVRPGSVEMSYVPGPPGETTERLVARLDRQAPWAQ